MKNIVSTNRLNQLLSNMTEVFRTREDAESRAEYLRIGTFKHAMVRKSSRGFEVVKIR